MASIDELFKGVGSKRKLDPIRDPNQIYKSARLNGSGSRHAQVEDEVDDSEAGPAAPGPDDEDNDGDYGPSMPPPEDEEGDDDEGRFFGGGITSQQREILDYVDGADAQIPAEQTIDAAWLRKTALQLERLITRNAEQRARFAADPAKFIQSEADLDGAVKGLGVLAEHPALYPELARLGSVGSLVGLLAHDNSDVGVDVLELLNELADEDVEATDEQWGALVDAAVDADLLGLLASNLERLDETEEVDRNGVYYAMGILESLCSRAATAEAVGANEALVKWLLARAQAKEQPVGQNKQYAAELLAILAQASPRNRQRLAADHDAVDALLQLAAAYRRRDPPKGSGEEDEYMENLFEALTCLADAAAGKAKLVEAEGVELCLLMLKEGKRSKPAALRLLDHAAAGGPPDAAAAVCERIVEAGGLKPLFTLFMKTNTTNNNKHNKDDGPTAEHLVGLFASLLRRLPGDSAARIRTLAKFVEKDYEKTAKLVALRRGHASRVAAADAAIRAEQASLDSDEEREAMADVWFSRRLDAGLFALQTIDVVLAWLAAEDDGARRTVARLLAERDEDLGVVRASVLAQRDAVDIDDGDDADDDDNGRDAADTKEMLSTLAEFLR